ncbi:hypothetical protein [Streptomyces sp. NBC_00388]|uniref:hypothetical protein n=1 Tax=Streptomyces sp. NBC_00388 TaxID=2975735 RepID=UPI002E1C1353
MDDRTVLNGIVRKSRTGTAGWDAPERHGPRATPRARPARGLGRARARILRATHARAARADAVGGSGPVGSALVRAHQHAAAARREADGCAAVRV